MHNMTHQQYIVWLEREIERWRALSVALLVVGAFLGMSLMIVVGWR